MALFQCSNCGCGEDTALCRYWWFRLQQAAPVCSACDPKIAKWHGDFPQQPARDWITDERGFWRKSDVENWLGQPIEIIGRTSSAASLQ